MNIEACALPLSVDGDVTDTPFTTRVVVAVTVGPPLNVPVFVAARRTPAIASPRTGDPPIANPVVEPKPDSEANPLGPSPEIETCAIPCDTAK
jgi:hypothetical protein